MEAENQPAVGPNILIVRLSSMGDVIHTMVAVSALRQAFPPATIGWVIEERWAELLCARSAPRCGPPSPLRPLVDTVHVLNSKTWRRNPFADETWREIAAIIRQLRAARYEIAVDFQGAIRSALVARWSGAPLIYGFAQPRENASSMFYTRQVQARGAHVIEQNLSLAIAVQGQEPHAAVSAPPFPRDELAESACRKKLEAKEMREYAILNPGAGWGAKQWPAERYGRVAKALAEISGIRSLINFGPGEEGLARDAEAASQGAATSCSTSLSELIAITRNARLFIGGDTGPMHLAAALRIPVVGIFGPTDPARNGPFGTRCVVLRNPDSITSHARRKSADEGMLEITSEHVIAAALQLLKDVHG